MNGVYYLANDIAYEHFIAVVKKFAQIQPNVTTYCYQI